MRITKSIVPIACGLAAIITLLAVMTIQARVSTSAVCRWTGPADLTPRDWSSVAFWDCGVIPGPDDTAIISGYGRVVNVDSPRTVQNLSLLDSSAVNGFSTLTVTGSMEWDGQIAGGAHLSPTGALETLVVAPGAVLSITNAGSDSRLLQGRLVNHGVVEHATGKTLRLYYATIDNRAGGVYRVRSGRIDKNNIYGSPDDGGWFENAGALIKEDENTFTLHAALTNSSQVSVTGGVLRVEMAADVQSVIHTGAFAVAAPGVLLLAGHAHHFGPSSAISGDGVFRLDGAHAFVAGTYNLTGLTDLWSSADLSLDTPSGAVSLPTVNMGGATRLKGSNDITVTQALTLSQSNAVVEGSTGVSNILTIAPEAVMWVQDAGGVSGRTLNNFGAIQLAGGGCFVVRGDAVVNIHPTGVFTVSHGRMDSCMPFVPAAGVINNGGRFVKIDPGDFIIDYRISLNNAGSLEVRDSALQADGPFRQTAGETFLNGSTLRNQNYHLVFDGGRLRGSGAIDLFQDRTLVNNGATIDPTGLLTLDEHYSQGSSGALQIDIGGLIPGSEHDQFVVGRQASLNGRLILAPAGGFTPAAGDSFQVMTYGSHSGQFTEVEPGLGPAFGPQYRPGGVVIAGHSVYLPLLVTQ